MTLQKGMTMKKPRLGDRVDTRFQYTPSGSTDIRKTFARARARIEREKQQQQAAELERISKVRVIR